MAAEEDFRDLRAEAWVEYIYPRVAVANLAEPPIGCGFIRAARVYERELAALTSANEVSDHDYADEMRAVSEARDIAYEMLSQLVSGPEREDVLRIVAKLDEVLGADLVREADPTGEVLQPLPFEQRRRMLEALDSAQKVAQERDAGQPPLILVMEDEGHLLLDEVRRRRQRDAAAERMSDYLMQLGVDPNESFEGDPRTTAQFLADAAMAGIEDA